MKKLGTVKFVQIQQNSLKEYLTDGTRIYNPRPLLKLKQIKLTVNGVIGITDNGDEILDVHNTKHPNSRYRGDNPISIGFTSHYNKMRAQMGDHLVDGIAGESIIIESNIIHTPETMNGRIAIENQDHQTLIYLNDIIPIPPCEPFSRFARGYDLTPQETKTTLQFLSGGTRGFYMKLGEKQGGTIVIQSGDTVYLVTD